MSRRKLIKQLKEKNPQLNQSELEMVVDTFSESISNALQSGKNVEIRGLGQWYTKILKENFWMSAVIIQLGITILFLCIKLDGQV